MKHFTNLISILSIFGILVGTTYNYKPDLYATAAYSTGVFPITSELQKIAPFSEYAINRLEKLSQKLHQKRFAVLNHTNTILQTRDKYKLHKNQSEQLLSNALQVLNTPGEPGRYEFIGKTYSLQTLNVQIDHIQQRIEELTGSIKLLDEKHKVLDGLLNRLDMKEKQLIAVKNNMKTGNNSEVNGMFPDIQQIRILSTKILDRKIASELRSVSRLLSSTENPTQH